eukprot:206906_1
MDAFPVHLFQVTRSQYNSRDNAINQAHINSMRMAVGGRCAINEINNLRVKEYEDEKQKEPTRIIQEPLLLDGYIRNVQQNEVLTQIIPTIINSICYQFYRAPPVEPCHLSSFFPIRRLKKEINDDLPDGCSADLIDNNLFKWQVMMMGPDGSPYYGGLFCLTALFPDEYPFKPPFVQFDTKIYHCNIGCSGIISLNILQHDWSPAWSLAPILHCVRSLLLAPNVDDPHVPHIAALYKADRRKHDSICREWTRKYAQENYM